MKKLFTLILFLLIFSSFTDVKGVGRDLTSKQEEILAGAVKFLYNQLDMTIAQPKQITGVNLLLPDYGFLGPVNYNPTKNGTYSLKYTITAEGKYLSWNGGPIVKVDVENKNKYTLGGSEGGNIVAFISSNELPVLETSDNNIKVNCDYSDKKKESEYNSVVFGEYLFLKNITQSVTYLKFSSLIWKMYVGSELKSSDFESIKTYTPSQLEKNDKVIKGINSALGMWDLAESLTSLNFDDLFSKANLIELAKISAKHVDNETGASKELLSGSLLSKFTQSYDFITNIHKFALEEAMNLFNSGKDELQELIDNTHDENYDNNGEYAEYMLLYPFKIPRSYVYQNYQNRLAKSHAHHNGNYVRSFINLSYKSGTNPLGYVYEEDLTSKPKYNEINAFRFIIGNNSDSYTKYKIKLSLVDREKQYLANEFAEIDALLEFKKVLFSPLNNYSTIFKNVDIGVYIPECVKNELMLVDVYLYRESTEEYYQTDMYYYIDLATGKKVASSSFVATSPTQDELVKTNNVSFNWDSFVSNYDSHSYTLYLKDKTTGEDFVFNNISNTTTTKLLKWEHEYSWYVAAIDKDGEHKCSNLSQCSFTIKSNKPDPNSITTMFVGSTGTIGAKSKVIATVVDAKGEPVSGVKVNFISNSDGYFANENTSEDGVCESDNSGNVEISYVPNVKGTHRVTAKIIGYESISSQTQNLDAKNPNDDYDIAINEFYCKNNYIKPLGEIRLHYRLENLKKDYNESFYCNFKLFDPSGNKIAESKELIGSLNEGINLDLPDAVNFNATSATGFYTAILEVKNALDGNFANNIRQIKIYVGEKIESDEYTFRDDLQNLGMDADHNINFEGVSLDLITFNDDKAWITFDGSRKTVYRDKLKLFKSNSAAMIFDYASSSYVWLYLGKASNNLSFEPNPIRGYQGDKVYFNIRTTGNNKLAVDDPEVYDSYKEKESWFNYEEKVTENHFIFSMTIPQDASPGTFNLRLKFAIRIDGYSYFIVKECPIEVKEERHDVSTQLNGIEQNQECLLGDDISFSSIISNDGYFSESVLANLRISNSKGFNKSLINEIYTIEKGKTFSMSNVFSTSGLALGEYQIHWEAKLDEDKTPANNIVFGKFHILARPELFVNNANVPAEIFVGETENISVDIKDEKAQLVQDAIVKAKIYKFGVVYKELDLIFNDTTEKYESLISLPGGVYVVDIDAQKENYIAVKKQFSLNVVSLSSDLIDKNFSIQEKCKDNEQVGFVIDDLKPGTSLSYSIISGNETDIFGINQTTGEFFVKNSYLVDYEQVMIYELEVKIQDNEIIEKSDVVILTVNITDVNEAPHLNDINLSTEENKISGTEILQFQGQDPEKSPLTYNIISGNDLGAFKVEENKLIIDDELFIDYEQNKEFILTIQCSDGLLNCEAGVSITITNLNDNTPKFNTIPTKKWNTGEQYEYIIEVSDLDGDKLKIIGEDLPEWMNLSDTKDNVAKLSFIASKNQAGLYPIELVIHENEVYTGVTQSFDFNLIPVNAIPEFASIPVEHAVVDEIYNYEIELMDFDEDELTIVGKKIPEWLSIQKKDNNHHVLSGIPTAKNLGDNTIILELNDGDLTEPILQEFSIYVNATPEFNSTPPTIAVYKENYQYHVGLADANLDAKLDFKVVSFPDWLKVSTLEDGSFLLSGIPSELGNYSIEMSLSDGIILDPIIQSFVITVGKASQIITFAELADKTFGDAAFDLVTASSSSEVVSFELLSGPAILEGNTLNITGAGEVTIKASQTGNENYLPAEAITRSFTVNKAVQVISFVELADKTFGDSGFELIATASTGLAVNFEWVSGPATLIENELTITGAGNVTVKAVQSGNENYAATSVSRTFTVNKAVQVISFAELADKIYGDEAFDLIATSSSSEDVTFELLLGLASLTGNTLSITGAGEVVLKATQAGNENYLAAEAITRSFTVNKAVQVISFAELANKSYGDATFDLVASSSSSEEVSFELISGPAILAGNTLSITGAGEVIIKGNQTGNENYLPAEAITQRFTVNKAVQVITFVELANKTYGDASFDLVATSSSSEVVSFELISGPATLVGNTLSITGAGEVSIKASQAGNENYLPAEAITRSFIVNKAVQMITFAELANKTYGDAAFDLVARSSSSEVVSFELLSGPATLTGNTLAITGAGEVTIKATQVGNENYLPADAITRTFTVDKAAQTITFAELANKTYGDAAFDLVASSSSSEVVSFELLSGPATLAGNTLSITGAGDVVLKANQAGNENYLAADAITRTLTVNKAAQTITFAELADRTYSKVAFELIASASSGLAVSFEVVSGPATLVDSTLNLTSAGEVTVKAVQSGNENYLAADVIIRSFTVKSVEGNHLPILGEKSFYAIVDREFNITMSASDEDDDEILISAHTGYSWINFQDNGNNSATISGVSDKEGLYSFTVFLEDGKGAREAYIVYLNVLGARPAPYIGRYPNTSCWYKDVRSYIAIETPRETWMTSYIVGIHDLPEGLKGVPDTFRGHDYRIEGTLTEEHIGEEYPITIKYYDGFGIDSLIYNYTLSIRDNDKPQIINATDTIVGKTTSFNKSYQIKDLDNELVYLSLESIDGSDLSKVKIDERIASEYNFTVSGAFDEIGTYKYIIVLKDWPSKGGGGYNHEIRQEISFEVVESTDENFLPEITSKAIRYANKGELYEYNMTVSDADNDPVSISNHTLPDWLTLTDNDDGIARLSGTPTELGECTVKLKISDGHLDVDYEFVIKVIEKIEMVYVEGGSFQMGDENGDLEGGCRPVHSVTLSDFEIGKYEVTQAQWKSVMGNDVLIYQSENGNLPANHISWSDAQLFLEKLNQLTGKEYRLPTEAEWEFAARGGSSSQSFLYSGSNNSDDVAWYDENSGGEIQTVGAKNANELGIYDMSGNVVEWCNDWRDYSYYSESPSVNPQGPDSGPGKVCRGGSWESDIEDCRVASRQSYHEGSWGGDIGFRLARSLKTAENSVPEFTSTAVTEAKLGEQYVYNISVADSDGDPLTFGASEKPDWLILTDFGDGTASLVGTPDNYGSYDVAIEVSDGVDSQKQEFVIEVAYLTSVEDFEEENSIKMYPNPAKDFVDLILPGSDAKQVTLINLRGQVLKSLEAYEKIRINVQDLKDGMYIIKIQTDQFVVTKRLLKVSN